MQNQKNTVKLSGGEHRPLFSFRVVFHNSINSSENSDNYMDNLF
jgi:hypothetical protein